MSDWKAENLSDDWAPIFETKKFLESSWSSVYPALSAIINNPISRPHMILSDYLVDAVRDMQIEHNIPVAMHWSQMPTNMLPASYIPGMPGLQREVLTSEHATLWQRIKAELLVLTMLPAFLQYRQWTRNMRARIGVHRLLPAPMKPDHLLLVNSFFGVEVPKDLPPNVVAVGPILSDTWPPLAPPLTSFTETHKRILYIALGTHVLLRAPILHTILAGLVSVLHADAIDGIIWAIRGLARKQLDPDARVPGLLADKFSVADLLAGSHPDILFLDFAPQRAVLAHPHTRVFVTHAGPASTNEAVFHGVPTVSIAVYFDQLQYAMRLRDAGVSIPLNKSTFTAEELTNAIIAVLVDPTGSITQNVDRLRGLARIASRRKHLAADLIEEVLVDWEGRSKGPEAGRPMHLQTADTRISAWRARNWDLWTILVAGLILGFVVVVGSGVGVWRVVM